MPENYGKFREMHHSASELLVFWRPFRALVGSDEI